MGRKGWSIIILVLVGAIIGAVVGYFAGKFAGAAEGALVGAIACGAAVLVPRPVWELLGGIAELVDCCSVFSVLAIAGIVTVGSLLLWHSLALSALVGVGSMTVMLVGLYILANSYSDKSKRLSARP